MLDVLKSRWQTRGWHPMVKEDSEPMALEFIRELDRAGVPWQHYRDLYNRSIDLRSRRMAQGVNCDDFSVDMMIACWPSLQSELHQREIDAGRTLTSTAQSQCLDCFGTGTQIIRHEDGTTSARPNCPHEHRADEPEVSDFSQVEAVMANRTPRMETAVEICARVRLELTKLFVTAEDEDVRNAAWDASRTWNHAERYCRQNPD